MLQTMLLIFFIYSFTATLYLTAHFQIRQKRDQVQAQILSEAGLEYAKYLQERNKLFPGEKKEIPVLNKNNYLEITFRREHEGLIFYSRGKVKTSRRTILGTMCKGVF